MKLKYLITTQTKGESTPRQIFNKYAIYEHRKRIRTEAGHTARGEYFPSTAESSMIKRLQRLLPDFHVRSMPDPADHNFCLFEALLPVEPQIEVVDA